MPAGRTVGVAAATAAVALVVGGVAAAGSSQVLKLSVAVLLTAGLVLVVARRPATAALLALGAFPFLGVLRRLIAPTGGGADPLVALPFGLALALVLLTGGLARPASRLSRLVLALIFVIAVEAMNPLQGSPKVGLLGAALMATPLLWFVVGRRVGNEQTLRRVAQVVIVVGLATTAYGAKQLFLGYAGFEKTWLQSHIDIYSAATVSGQFRPLSTFSSAAEFALFAGCAAAAAICYVRGPWRWAVAAACAVGVFLVGSRGAILLVLLGLTFLIVGRRSRGFVRPLLVIVPGVLLLPVLASQVTPPTGKSAADAIVQHVLEGFSSPFNKKSSTATLHATNAVTALKIGATQPLGHGPGTVNQASVGSATTSLSGESDVTDVFVALGVAGLGLYLAVVVQVVVMTRRLLRRGRAGPALMLPPALALITAQNWFVGGLYSVTALMWFTLGCLDHQVGPQPAVAPAKPAVDPVHDRREPETLAGVPA